MAVKKSRESVEEDRVRELDRIEKDFGGVDAVNALARGAVNGAFECMPAVLSAALGNSAALDALETREAREDSMRARQPAAS